MKKFSSGNERGAISGYVAGIFVLAILLIGGVILLKNIGDKSETNKPIAVESGEFKSDDTETEKKDETKPESTPAPADDKKTETSATTVATTGDTENTPETLTATGPEDFAVVMIGLVLAGGTIYVAWNYAKSRSMVKAALLSK